MSWLSQLEKWFSFWWHSWGAVAWPLIETLGLIGLLLGVCTVAVRYLEEYRRTKSRKEAFQRCKTFFSDTVATPSKALLSLFLAGLFLLGPFRLYERVVAENGLLASSNRVLMSQNQTLNAILKRKGNSLDTSDPVFPNFIYLLQAFRMYRVDIGSSRCDIFVTAPPDSMSIARVVAQFSIATSNCGTFGPFDQNSDPDVAKMTNDDLAPGVIIVHSARGDPAANDLYGRLESLIQLRRSYALPNFGSLVNPPPPKGTKLVWLQFGTNVKWNSELH